MVNEIYENTYQNENHFSFGKNWKRFLETLNEEKRAEAKISLLNFLGGDFKFIGKNIVDIGSGSGLFSWAIYDLGATRIESIDIDDFSLACTNELKLQSGSPKNWGIQKISALDAENLKSMGNFDLVYSWGVLHHTGNMWQAIANSLPLVASDGYFYIALYNKNEKAWLEGTSKFWEKAKVFYNSKSFWIKSICEWVYATYLCFGLFANGVNPWKYINDYESARGMDFMTDVRDWLGGYPYEYASVAEVQKYFEKNGFELINVKEVRSIGCNEFLFKRKQ